MIRFCVDRRDDFGVESNFRLNPRQLLRCGYLLKLKSFRHHSSVGDGQWKRYFVVLADELKLFENEAKFESGSPPKITVRLDFCTLLPSEAPNDMFEFSVFGGGLQPLTLRASSREEMNGWVAIFRDMPDCV